MSYQRILPRDLFNEAKLLKCLGRVSLFIHEGKLPEGFVLSFFGAKQRQDFQIQQTVDGDIYVSNLQFTYKGNWIPVYTSLNSRANYPLFGVFEQNPFVIFDEEGELDKEFKEFIPIMQEYL